MSAIFFVLAIVAAVAMFILGLVGSIAMQTREPARTRRENWFRVFDILCLSGAVWTCKTFRQNWKVRHQARRLILSSLACLGAFLVFIALHLWMEVAKI